MRRKFKKRNNKKRALVIFLGTAFVFVALISYIPKKQGFTSWRNWFNAQYAKNPSDSVKPVKKAIIPVIGEKELERDLILKHRVAARYNGIGRLDNFAELNDLVAKGKLVSMHETKGVLLAEMTHSFPYLTPNAKSILETIGYSFYTFSGDSSAFTVTSLTRTEESQEKLRKRNSNATREESTHCRGVSFDISYIRYNGVKEWNYERTKILERVLSALQERGDIYVIKERNQSCFHITVRK